MAKRCIMLYNFPPTVKRCKMLYNFPLLGEILYNIMQFSSVFSHLSRGCKIVQMSPKKDTVFLLFVTLCFALRPF